MLFLPIAIMRVVIRRYITSYMESITENNTVLTPLSTLYIVFVNSLTEMHQRDGRLLFLLFLQFTNNIVITKNKINRYIFPM